MTSAKFIQKEQHNAVTVVTISRPEKLNALNRQVVTELYEMVQEISGNNETRCMILTGAGDRAFISGADIAEMQALNPGQATAFAQIGHNLVAALERLSFPVIAAVNGFALGGGCELALACDFIYASDRAQLGQPEVNLGVIPGFGGIPRLARRVGIARARELVYTGRSVAADEALRIGLVNAVFPSAELMEKTMKVAQSIASMGPLAIRAAKQVLRDGEDRLLGDADALEIRAFAECFSTEDQREGMAAFIEKRKPKYRGE
ncbi:MAG: enoyl-CoA hydratase/isomerase family protein [Myxococcales bacterium]|nr:MAG: enoyl-CoA hydratase/isomerase family protein [Myxococcales bacterium]